VSEAEARAASTVEVVEASAVGTAAGSVGGDAGTVGSDEIC